MPAKPVPAPPIDMVLLPGKAFALARGTTYIVEVMGPNGLYAAYRVKKRTLVYEGKERNGQLRFTQAIRAIAGGDEGRIRRQYIWPSSLVSAVEVEVIEGGQQP